MDMEEQYDKIYRYCYFRLRDRQLAQDITQETFLRFFGQDLNLTNGRELAYLYTVAKNLCVDEFRKKPAGGTELAVGMEIGEEAACDKSEEWINHLAVRAALEKLPREEQELLLLRYVNEIPIASICEIKGMSRFAVYRRVSKSLKRLKEELKKEGFSE